jgi:hypothetical protein
MSSYSPTNKSFPWFQKFYVIHHIYEVNEVQVPQKSDNTTSTNQVPLKEKVAFPLMALPSNKILLSIDVGIKNLAMCLIDESTQLVLQWDVSGVPPQHQDGLFPCLRDHLDEKPWVLTATTILIEKQPGMNKTMKTVENFLHSYFVIKSPKSETIIYDARHKVPDIAGAGKARYRQRKQAAVDRCRTFLETSTINKHWMATFVASKKKDDLADTVLQALSYINRRVLTEPKKKGKDATEKKKVTARKPNENQKATKYSIPNMVWFLKNETRENLEKDKRFMKDLKRYYKDFDEFEKIIF